MTRWRVELRRAVPRPGRRRASRPGCAPVWVIPVTGWLPGGHKSRQTAGHKSSQTPAHKYGHKSGQRPAGVLARTVPGAAALAGLSVLLAACGGGAPSAGVAHIGSTTTTAAVAGPSGSPKSPGNVNAQLARFVSCMRAHGVPNFPDLVMEPDGGAVPARAVNIDKNSPYVQAARKDCQSVLPSGPPPGPAVTPKDQADYIRAAASMRSHGIPNFPDPTFSGNNVRFIAPPGMNATIGNSPQFLRAREILRDAHPAGSPLLEGGRGRSVRPAGLSRPCRGTAIWGSGWPSSGRGPGICPFWVHLA